MERIKKNIPVIIVGVILLCLIILLIVNIKDKNGNNPTKKGNDNNNTYEYVDKEKELENTVKIENAKMSNSHCKHRICVSNAKMYYADKKGRVTYTITNNSKETVTGYLKMNFGSNSLIIYYEDLKSGEVIDTVSYFDDMSFENVSDYKLEDLSKEELSKIVVR